MSTGYRGRLGLRFIAIAHDRKSSKADGALCDSYSGAALNGATDLLPDSL
jgi:hypothetical protein